MAKLSCLKSLEASFGPIVGSPGGPFHTIRPSSQKPPAAATFSEFVHHGPPSILSSETFNYDGGCLWPLVRADPATFPRSALGSMLGLFTTSQLWWRLAVAHTTYNWFTFIFLQHTIYNYKVVHSSLLDFSFGRSRKMNQKNLRRGNWRPWGLGPGGLYQ